MLIKFLRTACINRFFSNISKAGRFSHLFFFIFLNYNMLIITELKGKVETYGASHDHEESNRRKINFKNSSTCFMAIGRFFICSFPSIIYSGLRLTSDTLSNERLDVIFRLWSSTLLVMNSTFICLIFFWRNSILRREGMRTVKCSQSPRSWLSIYCFGNTSMLYFSIYLVTRLFR